MASAGHGGKRRRSELSEVAAEVVALKKQVASLSGQLRRRESDGIQACRGEMSAEREETKKEIETLRSEKHHLTSNRKEAQRGEIEARGVATEARAAETEARDAHLTTLHELTQVRLSLLEQTERADVLGAALTRAEKMVKYRNDKIAGLKSELLSVAATAQPR